MSIPRQLRLSVLAYVVIRLRVVLCCNQTIRTYQTTRTYVAIKDLTCTVLTTNCAYKQFELSSSRLSQTWKDSIEEKSKLGCDLEVI
jgi:hypothetical protein